MESRTERPERVFKTAWFAKAARKSHLGDDELCAAMRQVMLGQADDLGGGVYKKRLGKNLYRSIILARGGSYWVYEFLFAKNDMGNIDESRLARLHKLAGAYAELNARQVDEFVLQQDWIEICIRGGSDDESQT
jgi:hypothetical protein